MATQLTRYTTVVGIVFNEDAGRWERKTKRFFSAHVFFFTFLLSEGAYLSFRLRFSIRDLSFRLYPAKEWSPLLYVTVVSFCALEDGGQHLFCLCDCWMMGIILFVAVVWSGVVVISTAISKGVGPYFFGTV